MEIGLLGEVVVASVREEVWEVTGNTTVSVEIERLDKDVDS